MKKKEIAITLLPFLLFSCSGTSGDIKYLGETHETAVTYEGEKKEALVEKALALGESVFPQNENTVVSPIGFSLCFAAYALASSNSEAILSDLGVNDLNDYDKLMDALNWQDGDRLVSRLNAITFHQIVQDDDYLQFKEDFRQELAEHQVATISSSRKNFLNDASDLIEEAFGKKLGMPGILPPDTHGTVTYSALALKDTVEYYSAQNTFYGKEKTEEVDGIDFHNSCYYHEGTNYEALCFPVNMTDILFVLPKEGVDVSSLSLKDIYSEYKTNAEGVEAKGWLPFFSLESEIEATELAVEELGSLTPLDKLVTHAEDLGITQCKQKNRFIFSEKGVEGDSVTAIATDESAPVIEYSGRKIEFICNRPFKMISFYDDIPLFEGAVLDI